MASIVTGILALLLAVNAVNSLQCYSCNTNESGLCKWGLASITYKTEQCTSVGVLDSFIAPKCFKITAESKDGKEYIARGCLPPATIGCGAIASAVGWIGSQSNDKDALQNLSCDTCETDKCNSSDRVTGFTLIALVISGMIFMF